MTAAMQLTAVPMPAGFAAAEPTSSPERGFAAASARGPSGGTTPAGTAPPFDDVLAAATPLARPSPNPARRSPFVATPGVASPASPRTDSSVAVASKRPKSAPAIAAPELRTIGAAPAPPPTRPARPLPPKRLPQSAETASPPVLQGTAGPLTPGLSTAVLPPVVATTIVPSAPSELAKPLLAGPHAPGSERLPTPATEAAIALDERSQAIPGVSVPPPAGTAPGLAAVVHPASTSPAGPMAVLPTAPAIAAAPANPAIVAAAPAFPAPLPSAGEITVRRPAPRSSEPQTAAPRAANDAAPGVDGAPIGMTLAMPRAVPPAAPAPPPLPDRPVPHLAVTPAELSAAGTGEPGFSIDSRLLGPVSAALVPLNAAGDRLHVQFTVDRPATAALITGGSDRLDLTLGATGMRLDTLSVELDRRTAPEPPLGSPGSHSAGSHGASAQQDSAFGSGPRDPRRAPPGAPDLLRPRRGSPDSAAPSPRDRFA